MIKVHHLEYSRSFRIVWLLEELNEPYDLVPHKRNPQTFRATESLAATHPLGKAPIIEDNGLTLVESGAIIDYIITKYGKGRLAPPVGSRDWPRYLEWLHYAEGSAMMPFLVPLLGQLTGGLSDGLKAFILPEATKTLDYIDDHLKDREYLLGAELSGADINLHYALIIARMGNMLGRYQAIQTYLGRLESRPAFKKTVDIGGPAELPV